MQKPEKPNIPLNLTQARRRLVAERLPSLVRRLKADEPAPRTIRFTAKELQQVIAKCKAAIPKAAKRKVRHSLLRVVFAASEALECQKIGSTGQVGRLYQFKITLKGVKPPIWRRIQTKDCTLDKLHEHIQTSMGWTNSHLHQFTIGRVVYGDPELLYEGWEDETPPVNSLRTKVSKIVPADGKRFRFRYEHDFSDNWQHEILFECCPDVAKGTRYPLCVEGERVCPPEDVGGIRGYARYLKTLSDPEHKEWDETSEWRGPWRSEAFDALAATKAMRKGLPNWREME